MTEAHKPEDQPPRQITTKGMNPQEIAEALEKGQLDDYLKSSNRAMPPSTGADQGAR